MESTMKSIALFILSIGIMTGNLANAASSTLYTCSGKIVRQVAFNPNGKVYLITFDMKNSKWHQTSVLMDKKFQGVDGASYEADGFTVQWSNGLVSLTDKNGKSELCVRK